MVVCVLQASEESAVRVSADAELRELRERLAMKLEEEKAQMKDDHEQELKLAKEKGEAELKQVCMSVCLFKIVL